MPEMFFFFFFAILSLLGYKFHEPGEVTASSTESGSLMDDHSKLSMALHRPLPSPPLERGPWREGTQHLTSQAQGACKILLQVSLSESSALSLSFYASFALWSSGSWLELQLAHMSGRPDIKVTMAHKDVRLTHLEASWSSRLLTLCRGQRRNLTHKVSRQWDSVTLFCGGPDPAEATQPQHTSLAWLLRETTDSTGQSQGYCPCKCGGARTQRQDRNETDRGKEAQKHP